ncbi:hypothetical protein IQ250_00605 [Pseudanabaenaceae cyanobacterium LEGE 13415]|nr:hypothetical protein [Pseudanabaenaceae cyanobacterium LEGE 13415]
MAANSFVNRSRIVPIVYSAESSLFDEHNLERMASHYLYEPALLTELCDRIYQLWLTDVRYQQERAGNYRRGRF